MPMGGGGTRFFNVGYESPKPLINIYGKPFFYWATMSILKYNDIADLTFVVLKDHIDRFNIDVEIKKYFPYANIRVLDHILNGPTLTCLEGVKDINDDLPIMFNDCDHMFKSSPFNNACKNRDVGKINGALITFDSNLAQYSYVTYKDGKVNGTIEKNVASSDAICGAYLFKNRKQFESLAASYLNNCNYKEFFVSGLYNEMIKAGMLFEVYKTDYHVSFGTPEEYELALSDRHYEELL